MSNYAWPRNQARTTRQLSVRTMSPRLVRSFPAPAPEIQADWLSRLLQLLDALAREGWVWSPVAVRALGALVSSDSWRSLNARQRAAALAELRDLESRLAALADGRAVKLEIRNASLVTWFNAGTPERQAWTWDLLQTSFAATAMTYLTDGAVCRRCRRCGRLFAAARGRGRLPRYCPGPCSQTARTQRWRNAHRDEFRAKRRAAYKRRVEGLYGRRIKIQPRRRAVSRTHERKAK
jgi:hypothetical protein